MNELIVALWGAATVFVLWVAFADLVLRRRRMTARLLGFPEPEPTPEELLEAQSLYRTRSDEDVPAS